MAIVERDSLPFPMFVWATNIEVAESGNGLSVSGVVPVGDEGLRAAPDLFRAYRQAIRPYGPQKREGKSSPHIQFANADTDQKLIRFVRRFGPVVVTSSTTEDRAITSDDPFDFRTSETVLRAHQDLGELRNERELYRAALVLISELKRGKAVEIQTIQRCVCEIAAKVWNWPNQYQREREMRTSGQGYMSQPAWVFGEDDIQGVNTWKFFATRERSGDPLKDALSPGPIHAGHNMICQLVNAFSPTVYAWGNTPVEAPHLDVTCGIRPILYYILRREYLQTSGIGVCRNIECREVFEIERAGQEFCSEECSRHQRQREYWKNRGKNLRERRLAARKSAVRGAPQ